MQCERRGVVFLAMDNLYLGHLSRPQLVNLLLRIVDLLAQPLPQPEQPLHPGQAMQAPPILEPYDAPPMGARTHRRPMMTDCTGLLAIIGALTCRSSVQWRAILSGSGGHLIRHAMKCVTTHCFIGGYWAM